MWFEFFDFWGRETLDNIRRNRLMSLLAITSVTVGLFILGAFYLTIYNVRTAVKEQTHKLDLVILLRKDVTPKRRRQLFEAARIPQVASVTVALSHQVFKEEQQGPLRGSLADMESAKPFHDELRIKLKNPEDLFAVRKYLTSLAGVEGARENPHADKAAAALLAFHRFVTIAGLVSLVVLGIAILLIIHNAIRLTVHARRREIRIMHLVGATPGFIRVPFLLEGIVYGAVGGGLASAILGGLSGLARTSPVELVQNLAPPADVFGSCVLLLLAAGMLFGLLGAWLSFNHSHRSATV